MILPAVIAEANDPGGLLILSKAYSRLLGIKAAALLTYISDQQQQKDLKVEIDGVEWLRFSLNTAAWYTALGFSGARIAKESLVKQGLVYCRQDEGSVDRTLFWRLNDAKFARFFEFANALTLAIKPVPDVASWLEWKVHNADIVEEFRYLWPRVDNYQVKKILMVRTKAPANQSMNIKGLFKAEQAPKRRPALNKYVEYWNSLPYVPACRPGTKAYSQASAFFRAHQYYEAGQCNNFMLTPDEARKDHLQTINKIPINPICAKTSGRPIRPHAQMIKHIQLAAKAYDPAYTPANKQYLGRSLPNFLFSSYGKGGTFNPRSRFLECLISRKPLPLEDFSLESLMERAEDYELYIIEAITRLYNFANSRGADAGLDLAEFKIALTIARKIAELYCEIPVDKVPILGHHFGDYRAFVQWWENYCEDHVWEGMPLNALHPAKNLWKRFIDFISDDLGYNVLTGERR